MFSVLVPCYEDRASLAHLLNDIERLYAGSVLDVVVVDDGSVSEPVEHDVIPSVSFPVTILRLRRNVGHQAAIAIGLCHVSEDPHPHPVVVMDSDGEDQPTDIARLLAEQDSASAIVASRGHRLEGMKFRVFYAIYKNLFALITGRKIDFGNFSVLKPDAIARLRVLPETWVHYPAALLYSKISVNRVTVDRGGRYAGHSKMNFSSLVLHGLRAVTVFSLEALTRSIICAGYVAGGLLLIVVTALTLKFVGLTSPGWVTLLTGFAFVIVLQIALIVLFLLVLLGGRSFEAPPDYRRFVDSTVHLEPTTTVL